MDNNLHLNAVSFIKNYAADISKSPIFLSCVWDTKVNEGRVVVTVKEHYVNNLGSASTITFHIRNKLDYIFMTEFMDMRMSILCKQ